MQGLLALRVMPVSQCFNVFNKTVDETQSPHQLVRPEIVGPYFDRHFDQAIAEINDTPVQIIVRATQNGAGHDVIRFTAQLTYRGARGAFTDEPRATPHGIRMSRAACQQAECECERQKTHDEHYGNRNLNFE